MYPPAILLFSLPASCHTACRLSAIPDSISQILSNHSALSSMEKYAFSAHCQHLSQTDAFPAHTGKAGNAYAHPDSSGSLTAPGLMAYDIST